MAVNIWLFSNCVDAQLIVFCTFSYIILSLLEISGRGGPGIVYCFTKSSNLFRFKIVLVLKYLLINKPFVMSVSNSDKTVASFQANDHSQKLLQYVEEQRKQGSFNDVTIIADKQSIPCNKLVLSCYSKFFEMLFRTNFKEKYQNQVEINGFDGQIIELIIDYIYSGSVKIENKNVMDIVSASDYLQLDSLKHFCFEFLESEVTAENCLEVIRASILYKPGSCLDKAYQLLSENLEEISQTEMFQVLSKTELISILEKMKKNESSEEAKYTAITHWVKCDRETRSKDFPQLFQSIDLNKLPFEFLKNVATTDSLVEDNFICTKAVLACCMSMLNKMKSNESGSKILCIVGNDSKQVFELSDSFRKSNKTYPQLPVEVLNNCVAKVNNFIYIVGGWKSNKVYQMNLNDPVLQWREVASMNKARSQFGCGVFNGTLVVAGGSHRLATLASTELYEEQSNTWRMISSLNRSRNGHALVVCEGRLYAIGGELDSSVECMRDVGSKWEEVASMKTSRCNFATVNCSGYIYAIGGWQEFMAQKSVERYNPDGDEWIGVAPMNIARYGHSAYVKQNKIFVVGGTNDEGKFVHEVECYDTRSNTWSIVGETDVDLCDHVLIVI